MIIFNLQVLVVIVINYKTLIIMEANKQKIHLLASDSPDTIDADYGAMLQSHTIKDKFDTDVNKNSADPIDLKELGITKYLLEKII